MTKKQLRQIYYIDREIKMWEKELANTKRQHNAIDTDIETTICKLIDKLIIQKGYIIKYIYDIDDSLIRQIVYLRNVCLMSWNDISKKVGGGNTSDSVRMLYNRFFKDSA